MKTRAFIWILGLLLTVRLTLAVATPVFDTSEARYAAMCANMDRDNDFLVPRFVYDDTYQSFDGKPPLLFQLGGLACKAFGRSEFAVRLPVLAATLLLLMLLWKTVKDLSNAERAWWAVCIASTCVAYYALAGFCMPDGLLTPAVGAAYLTYITYLKTGSRKMLLGTFAALGVGMLVKGPVALVLFGMPAFLDACVNKRWRTIFRFPLTWVGGLLLFLAIAAPWFVLMTRENPGFLKYFFINENLLRFLVHDYGDKYGAGRETFRGMSVIWAFVVTLPWSPFLYICGRPHFRDPSPLAVLVWGCTGIIGFWALTSRVPLAYLMPIVPLFATYLAVKGDGVCVKWAIPFAAGIAMVILSVSLMTAMLTTNKMMGAEAPYKHNRYSYEFYHGHDGH